MREPIDLDAKRGFIAEEVESVVPERVLAAKLELVRPAAEHVPEPPLRGRHSLAQFPRSVGGQFVFLTADRAAES